MGTVANLFPRMAGLVCLCILAPLWLPYWAAGPLSFRVLPKRTRVTLVVTLMNTAKMGVPFVWGFPFGRFSTETNGQPTFRLADEWGEGRARLSTHRDRAVFAYNSGQFFPV